MTEPGTYTVEPAGTVLHVCLACGAVVYALGKHTEWHAALSAAKGGPDG